MHAEWLPSPAWSVSLAVQFTDRRRTQTQSKGTVVPVAAGNASSVVSIYHGGVRSAYRRTNKRTQASRKAIKRARANTSAEEREEGSGQKRSPASFSFLEAFKSYEETRKAMRKHRWRFRKQHPSVRFHSSVLLQCLRDGRLQAYDHYCDGSTWESFQSRLLILKPFEK